jgi:hypothetical protein
MSRLGSDGIVIDPLFFLKCYSDAIREISGKTVDIQSIVRHIAAANVITSFAFWHQFLHGAETERVRGIYEKMADDFRLIEAPGEPGVYVAELDLDRLRTHRSNDIMGDKYRHPEKYGILSNPDVRDVIGGEFVHW